MSLPGYIRVNNPEWLEAVKEQEEFLNQFRVSPHIRDEHDELARRLHASAH